MMPLNSVAWPTRSRPVNGSATLRTVTFLAIDIGNTRLKWALYDAPLPGAGPRLQGAVFLENIDALADGSLFVSDRPRATALSQRSAAIEEELMAALERWELLGSR